MYSIAAQRKVKTTRDDLPRAAAAKTVKPIPQAVSGRAITMQPRGEVRCAAQYDEGLITPQLQGTVDRSMVFRI